MSSAILFIDTTIVKIPFICFIHHRNTKDFYPAGMVQTIIRSVLTLLGFRKRTIGWMIGYFFTIEA